MVDKHTIIAAKKEVQNSGRISESHIKILKDNFKLNDEGIALVFNELAIDEANNKKYDIAKLLFRKGIEIKENVPMLHYNLGMLYLELYEKENFLYTNAEEAAKEFKKCRSLIRGQNLEKEFKTVLDSINENLKLLNPDLKEYPDILRRAITDALFPKPAPQIQFINTGSGIQNNNTGAGNQFNNNSSGTQNNKLL